jgi:uncharacterized protein (TIGR03083 family)
MSMDVDFLAHLRADSARFADVLGGIDPGAPVPTCPEWTAVDLLWHLAEVQHFWGTIVRDRLTDPESYEQPARPDAPPALMELFTDSSALLSDALAGTPDDVAVWTWFDADQSVGFVRRRQAHEALIHRLDAELTAGLVTDVDPALATDGVLEAIEWMFGDVPAWATSAGDGPLGRLSTTDTATSWFVRVGRWSGTSPNTGRTYTDEPTLLLADGGEPTFEITGSARDLDAWMWNRPLVGELHRSGDIEALETVIRQGVQ